MTQISSICTVGLTGEALTSDACGGHVRPEMKVFQAGPVKQEVISVRKNPLDSSRGEVNEGNPTPVREFGS